MFYSREELNRLGVKIGENVSVHKTVQFFGAPQITIGSNTRIDCFVVITAEQPVDIGCFVHIGAASHIFGTAGVVIEDYANISSRVSLFSTSDDYIDGHMSNPTIEDEFKKVVSQQVRVQSHAILGCGCIILPGADVGKGAAIGALSLVKASVPAFHIFAGIPAKQVGVRNQERLLKLESEHRKAQPK